MCLKYLFNGRRITQEMYDDLDGDSKQINGCVSNQFNTWFPVLKTLQWIAIYLIFAVPAYLQNHLVYAIYLTVFLAFIPRNIFYYNWIPTEYKQDGVGIYVKMGGCISQPFCKLNNARLRGAKKSDLTHSVWLRWWFSPECRGQNWVSGGADETDLTKYTVIEGDLIDGWTTYPAFVFLVPNLDISGANGSIALGEKV